MSKSPDEERMAQIAECLGRMLQSATPAGVRFCLVVEDDRAWATYGSVDRCLPMAQRYVASCTTVTNTPAPRGLN